jgi:thiamine-monophosphate kinase
MIRRALSPVRKDSALMLGIGDDAAVFRTSGHVWNVVTVDAMAEGIHFDLRYTDLRKLGWKALASNISDLAAMGAEPKWALINLTIPERISAEDIRELYRGISVCSKKYGTQVIGGNITRAKNEFVIGITALGEVGKTNILKRSTAKVGDIIAVTGDLGGSHAGLRILQKRKRANAFKYVLQKHLNPTPRIEVIRKMQRSGVKIHACIDISDGLSSDLMHVCAASKVGAELELDKIPIHTETKNAAAFLREDVLSYALNGGEEYELLMTMAPKDFKKTKLALGRHITSIGRINASRKLTGNHQNKTIVIEAKGFTHF